MWWDARNAMGDAPGSRMGGAPGREMGDAPGREMGQRLGREMEQMPCRDNLVTAVAVHENLTPTVAGHKVAAMLGESWGPPAIRQMIQDEIDRAATSGRWPNIESLIDTYQWCCENLPTGNDRRTQSRPH